MSTKSSLQSLLTHPLAGSATAREICESLGQTACRLKTPYTALRGIPMRLKMAGALIPVLLRAIRAITLQRCRIVVRGILGQYQYYCMFCLVTNIVCSNLKSKNQEVSGFSDQNAYQHFCLKGPNFHDIWKSQSSKISTFKKKCHYFCTGVYTMGIIEHTCYKDLKRNFYSIGEIWNDFS